MDENHKNKTETIEKSESDKYSNQEKTYYKVNCSKCGEETEVPFKPTEGRDVFCRSCYRKTRPRY